VSTQNVDTAESLKWARWVGAPIASVAVVDAFPTETDVVGESELLEVYQAQQIEAQVMPEIYARINVTKNAKGYSSETTVSVRGELDIDQFRFRLRELNRLAREEAMAEIACREAIDRGEHVQAEAVAVRVETAHTAESIEDLPF